MPRCWQDWGGYSRRPRENEHNMSDIASEADIEKMVVEVCEANIVYMKEVKNSRLLFDYWR